MVSIMENSPAKRALATLNGTAPTAPAVDRPKKISKKVIAAIDALVSGDVKKIADAAAKAGLARESLSRALAKPHVAEALRARTAKHLALLAARAGAVKEELLESSNEIVRDRSSSFILGLSGIAPATTPSVSINLELKAGYIIDLSDDPPPMRVVSPE
jgi:hypothetical protein